MKLVQWEWGAVSHSAVYANPYEMLRLPLAMSTEERAEYKSILHCKAVDKLHRITNGKPLEMGVLKEFSMLFLCADPEDSTTTLLGSRSRKNRQF